MTLNKDVFHSSYVKHRTLDCEVIPPVPQSWCHGRAIRKKWLQYSNPPPRNPPVFALLCCLFLQTLWMLVARVDQRMGGLTHPVLSSSGEIHIYKLQTAFPRVSPRVWVCVSVCVGTVWHLLWRLFSLQPSGSGCHWFGFVHHQISFAFQTKVEITQRAPKAVDNVDVFTFVPRKVTPECSNAAAVAKADPTISTPTCYSRLWVVCMQTRSILRMGSAGEWGLCSL